MPDNYDFLLGSKPVETQGPLGILGQTMSLSNLYNQAQLGQMNVAAAQQQAAAVPEFSAGIAAGQDPNQLLQTMATKYPYAYPKLLADWKQQQLTQAQTAKETALGQQATEDAHKTAVGLAGNQGYQIAQRAANGQPIPPAARIMLQGQLIHAAKINGDDPSQIPFPPMDAQDAFWGDFGRTVSSGAITPEQNSAIDKATSDANLARVQAGQEPLRTQAQLIQARAAATQASVAQAKQTYGEPSNTVNSLDGTMYHFTPGNPAKPPSMTQLMDPSGQPVQVAPTSGQTQALGAMKGNLEQINKQLAASWQVKRLAAQALPVLQNSDAFSGPLANSEEGRAFLGTVYPFLSKQQQAAWGNMKISEVLTTPLLGGIISQISPGRGSVFAMSTAKLAKPGAENPQAVRIDMLKTLANDADNDIAQNSDKATYLVKNAATDPMAAKWQPPPVKAVQLAGASAPLMPPPAAIAALQRGVHPDGTPATAMDFDQQFGRGSAQRAWQSIGPGPQQPGTPQ